MKPTLTIQDITADPRARKGFQEQLRDGTSLSRRVHAEADFSLGKLFVGLPENADPGRLPDLVTGHLPGLRYGVPAERTLAKIVQAFLGNSGGIVLIQDTQALVDDPWLQDYEHRNHIVSYKEELYWQLKTGEFSEDKIRGVVSSGSSYPFAAFFYVAQTHSTEPEAQLDDSAFNKIVETLAGVAVGAFDGESFLLWWKQGTVPALTGESS
ncbi:MAG TPA: hypothetical protein VKS22_17105 [Candidatus Binataceae bacterium]|nr:hypothetical protein [Candidatus Binataceae bacterium]